MAKLHDTTIKKKKGMSDGKFYRLTEQKIRHFVVKYGNSEGLQGLRGHLEGILAKCPLLESNPLK